jgi:hypothetical protein
MQATDKPDFLKVLNGMAAMRKATLIPEVLDLWWGCMADWSIEDFKAAAIQVLKTSTFMPTPKDFEDLRKAGRETAGEVFASIKQWLQYTPNGYTLKPKTPHAIAASIRAMGGPNAYAMCQEDKLPFLERRFCDHYEHISEAGDIRDGLPQIAQARKRLAQS